MGLRSLRSNQWNCCNESVGLSFPGEPIESALVAAQRYAVVGLREIDGRDAWGVQYPMHDSAWDCRARERARLGGQRVRDPHVGNDAGFLAFCAYHGDGAEDGDVR